MFMKLKKKPEEEKIDKIPDPIEELSQAINSMPSTQNVKIAAFSGDFGREDLHRLRDKVNEIIDYINNHEI